jgi:hypothetical protein
MGAAPRLRSTVSSFVVVSTGLRSSVSASFVVVSTGRRSMGPA